MNYIEQEDFIYSQNPIPCYYLRRIHRVYDSGFIVSFLAPNGVVDTNKYGLPTKIVFIDV